MAAESSCVEPAGRLGARGSEAHALCLAGDVASRAGAEDAPGYYREALALAGALGMRPLVAHCHLGLAKLCRRTGKRKQAQEHLSTATTMYRDMDMRFWLEQAEAALSGAVTTFHQRTRGLPPEAASRSPARDHRYRRDRTIRARCPYNGRADKGAHHEALSWKGGDS